MKVHLANSNTWSDGNEYIMGIASEVHTNALFDIYPNDTTITADFKGNTVQSGTPSPSAPVPVVGVGDLDGTAYKILVEIGLSTQSIDLSAVQSARNIKKLILDGTENWSKRTEDNIYYIVINDMKTYSVCMCDTYKYVEKSTSSDLLSGEFTTRLGIGIAMWFKDDNISTIDAWKAYLHDNNVTALYILADPVTDTINAPLQKIGEYADSISNITLTTTAGAKSFGVDTAVKPSEITLNFRGWHPKDPKESTGGEWG